MQENGFDYEIIEVERNEKKYTYVQVTIGGLAFESSQFYHGEVTEKTLELVYSFGGLMRDMLYREVVDTQADSVTVLTYINTRMDAITKVLMEKDGNIVGERHTTDPYYHNHMWMLFRVYPDAFENLVVDSSLNYFDHPKYGMYLKDYYSPKSLKETGLYIDGNPIHYGDTLSIEGYAKYIGHAIPLRTVEVEIHSKTYDFNILGKMRYVKEQGDYVSVFEMSHEKEVLGGQPSKELLHKEMNKIIKQVTRGLEMRKLKIKNSRYSLDEKKEMIEKLEKEYKGKCRTQLKELFSSYRTPSELPLSKEGLEQLLLIPDVRVVSWMRDENSLL